MQWCSRKRSDSAMCELYCLEQHTRIRFVARPCRHVISRRWQAHRQSSSIDTYFGSARGSVHFPFSPETKVVPTKAPAQFSQDRYVAAPSIHAGREDLEGRASV